MAWLLDLDGVVWRGEQPIAGAAAAVARIRDAGQRVLFLTNNSSATVADYQDKLAGLGMHADARELVTSAQAAATLVGAGERALVCAGPGVDEALRARRVVTVRDGVDVDAVVVGWHRDFDFERLTAAFLGVTSGGRLIGTNDDPTYPTPEGAVPGGGAILAAVATACGVAPTIAGKPHEPMQDLVRDRLGDELEGSVLVGDRPSTDGLMARRLGIRFALVLSGVTQPGDLPVVPAPEVVGADLAAIVVALLDQRGV